MSASTRKKSEYALPLTAHHEAGHAIVAHALGMHVDSIVLDNPRAFVRTKFPIGPASSIEDQRRHVTVVTAGPIAGIIHQRQVEKRGFSCRQEGRVYESWWNFKISLSLDMVFTEPESALTGPAPESDGDLQKVIDALNFIVPIHVPLGILGVNKLKKAIAAANKGRVKRMLSEVIKAEKKAETIIKRHWEAVTDVANVLIHKKEVTISRKQFLKAIEPHSIGNDTTEAKK